MPIWKLKVNFNIKVEMIFKSVVRIILSYYIVINSNIVCFHVFIQPFTINYKNFTKHLLVYVR